MSSVNIKYIKTRLASMSCYKLILSVNNILFFRDPERIINSNEFDNVEIDEHYFAEDKEDLLEWIYSYNDSYEEMLIRSNGLYSTVNNLLKVDDDFKKHRFYRFCSTIYIGYLDDDDRLISNQYINMFDEEFKLESTTLTNRDVKTRSYEELIKHLQLELKENEYEYSGLVKNYLVNWSIINDVIDNV